MCRKYLSDQKASSARETPTIKDLTRAIDHKFNTELFSSMITPRPRELQRDMGYICQK